jgi:hypothetical protein
MEYCTGFKARKKKTAERAKRLEEITTVLSRMGLSSLDDGKKDYPVCFSNTEFRSESLMLSFRSNSLAAISWVTGAPRAHF